MIERLSREELVERCSRIRVLLLDCDGVLTDGGIYITAEGEEIKRFSTLDGHGIVMWRETGRTVGIISGRGSKALETRAAQLGVEFLVQRSVDKLASFHGVLQSADIDPQDVAYMGDDLPDLGVLSQAGLAIAPSNAVEEVLDTVHLITERGGGNGAVREVVEYILKQQGEWELALARYV